MGSKTLFDVITKCSKTQEMRLMMESLTVRDSCSNYEIREVVFLRGPNNPVDGLTKIGKCHALDHLLRTVKGDFAIDQ